MLLSGLNGILTKILSGQLRKIGNLGNQLVVVVNMEDQILQTGIREIMFMDIILMEIIQIIYQRNI